VPLDKPAMNASLGSTGGTLVAPLDSLFTLRGW
jgi:hypothetical protein